MISTSFQVIVDEYLSQPPNHQFSMLIDKPFNKIYNASIIRDFIYKLSATLDPMRSDGIYKIRLNAIEENGPQTLLRWSNASLSGKKCDKNRIEQIQSQMIVLKSNLNKSDKVKLVFERGMGKEFHVRKVCK